MSCLLPALPWPPPLGTRLCAGCSGAALGKTCRLACPRFFTSLGNAFRPAAVPLLLLP